MPTKRLPRFPPINHAPVNREGKHAEYRRVILDADHCTISLSRTSDFPKKVMEAHMRKQQVRALGHPNRCSSIFELRATGDVAAPSFIPYVLLPDNTLLIYSRLIAEELNQFLTFAMVHPLV